MQDDHPTVRRLPALTDRDKFAEIIGTRIGDYIIDDFVGVGGQAVVFSAHSQPVGGKYALKIFGLLDSVRGGLEEGLNEAKKQSLIDHPAVVKVFPPGIDNIDFQNETLQVLFLPMSFSALGSCEGQPPFAGRQLSEFDFKAMLNLLDGLSDIHQAGLIHNDIKPANILKFHERIDGDDRINLRITDFGIAKVLTAMGAGNADPSGFTLAFMSPEQLDHSYSEKGDIYSMGATLYHMVTGVDPISAPDQPSNLFAWQKAHQAYPRPNAHKANAFCPPRLALLIMRMMSVDPLDRPSIVESINELRTIIQNLLGQLFEFKPPKKLESVLESQSFPIAYHCGFHGIFKPEVHEACGLTLFVLRLKMRHPVLEQYKRLVRCVTRQFSDSYSMYETWGSYDVNLFIWSDQGEIDKLSHTLSEQFPGSEPQLAAVERIHHFHAADNTMLDSPSPVLALAVQEGITIPGFSEATYLCGKYPAEMPDRSIRAFTYVEAAEDTNKFLFRKAIAEHVRGKLLSMWRARPRDFQRMSVLELSADSHSRLSATAVIVDFVATEYKYLPDVPTTVIESLGENAVRTLTCLETRRIMIQSDRILL